MFIHIRTLSTLTLDELCIQGNIFSSIYSHIGRYLYIRSFSNYFSITPTLLLLSILLHTITLLLADVIHFSTYNSVAWHASHLSMTAVTFHLFWIFSYLVSWLVSILSFSYIACTVALFLKNQVVEYSHWKTHLFKETLNPLIKYYYHILLLIHMLTTSTSTYFETQMISILFVPTITTLPMTSQPSVLIPSPRHLNIARTLASYISTHKCQIGSLTSLGLKYIQKIIINIFSLLHKFQKTLISILQQSLGLSCILFAGVSRVISLWCSQ